MPVLSETIRLISGAYVQVTWLVRHDFDKLTGEQVVCVILIFAIFDFTISGSPIFWKSTIISSSFRMFACYVSEY